MPKCICGHDEVDHIFYKEACIFNDDYDCYRYEPDESNTEEVVASYISGIRHGDVLPDEIDVVMRGEILNYIDKRLDYLLEQR